MSDAIDTATYLSPPVLTDIVRTYKLTGQNTQMSDLFRKRGKQSDSAMTPLGERAFWKEIRHSRGRSPFVGASSPAPVRARLASEDKSSPIARVKQTRKIGWDRLFLGSVGSSLQEVVFADYGKQVLMDEIDDMLQENQNSVEFACAQILATGGLDTSTVPGSDASFTLDFTVNTLSAASPWDASGTQIISDELPKIMDKQIADAALAPRTALFNSITYRGFLKNEEIQKFGRNEKWAENFLRADITNPAVLRGVRVGDIDWGCNPYGFDSDDKGTFARWIADNRIIFLPDDLQQVLLWVTGKCAIPRNVFGVPAGAPDGIEIVKGKGPVCYVKYVSDPCGIEIFLEEAFLPILPFPKSILYFNSKP